MCHEAGQSATADGVITPNFASQHRCKYSDQDQDDDGVTFFRADLSEVHHVPLVSQKHHRHLFLLLSSSVLGLTLLNGKVPEKIKIVKKKNNM